MQSSKGGHLAQQPAGVPDDVEAVPRKGTQTNPKAACRRSSFGEVMFKIHDGVSWQVLALCLGMVAIGLTLGLVFGLAINDDKDDPVAPFFVRQEDATESAQCTLQVTEAQYFNVTTFSDGQGTLLLNKFNKKAYVLVPAASEMTLAAAEAKAAPLIPSGYNTSAFQTPLDNVTVTETQLTTYIELLGARRTISEMSSYTTSPCLQKLRLEGDVSYFTGATWDPTFKAESPNVHFTGYTAHELADSVVQCAVSVEQRDGTMLQSSEWIKFFAPFFGKECEANAIFDRIKERYACHKAKVDEVYSSLPPVKVAVTERNFGYDCADDYGEGCDPTYNTAPYFGVTDAEYWKSYIQDAGGSLMTETTMLGGTALDTTKDAFVYESEAAFHDVLKEASVLIDQTYFAEGNVTLAKILDAYGLTLEDTDYPFIRDKAIWRNDRRVSAYNDGNDWFESRYPEADVLLEDMIFTVHPMYSEWLVNPGHSMTWLRNMFTGAEQIELTAAMCEDPNVAAKLIADECTSIRTN